MSNARRSIAQLRAEKEARLRNMEEGMYLRNAVMQAINNYENHGFADPSTRCLQVAALLEKAARACILLEETPFIFDRAVAHQYKGMLHRDLGQIGEALAAYREARRWYALSGKQLLPEADGSVRSTVRLNSTKALIDMGKLLQSANQLQDGEKIFHEVLSMPNLSTLHRFNSVQGLAHIHN
jgi:tetratricopeptide (TPR) repeat protein